MEYHLNKLSSGIRVLEIPMKEAESITVLVLFNVGSRYEDDKIAGLSHFLEHMHFKGSAKRPSAAAISEAIDEVGGEMNAFTSKEYTGYYIKVAAQHSSLALDVLSDMLQSPLFQPEEIEREKGVIVEEIKMYEDQPMLYVGELFEEKLFNNTSLGRQTIGTKETVHSLKRDDFINYRSKYYTPENTLVVIAGNTAGIAGRVGEYFHPISSAESTGCKSLEQSIKRSDYLMYQKPTEQTHLWVGFRTISMNDPKRFTHKVMSTILGGGMSSRLFMQVRERRGLAYYVRAASEHYTDAGYLVASAGVATEKFEEAMTAILGEIDKLKIEKVAEKELLKAKEYLKGKLLLNLEQSDDRAEFFGIQELLKHGILTPKEISEKYDEVSAEEVRKLASDWFVKDNLFASVISSKDYSHWLDNNLKV